jgi:hypothetical protein
MEEGGYRYHLQLQMWIPGARTLHVHTMVTAARCHDDKMNDDFESDE